MMDHPNQNRNDPVPLFTAALNDLDQGRLQESKAALIRLRTDYPDNWLIHFYLGLLYHEDGNLEESLESYEKAVSITDSSGDLFYNYAICQKDSGLLNDAVISYQKALALDPKDHDARYNLGSCYCRLDRYQEAIDTYTLLLKSVPEHQSALNNLAYLYHKIGKKKKALIHYRKLLAINPGHESASYMISALTGEKMATAPPSYVRDVFNQYADHYENSLIDRLAYTLPETLTSLIVKHTGITTFTSILDLGCGTGLIGTLFQPYCLRIDGVDISENMLRIAESKGIYSRLVAKDFSTLSPADIAPPYHLIIAADVFSYIGALETVFSLLLHCIEETGHFWFSVENSEYAESYVLQESGRFAHSRHYVETVARQTGWVMYTTEPVHLRKERGGWVHGMVYGISPGNSS